MWVNGRARREQSSLDKMREQTDSYQVLIKEGKEVEEVEEVVEGEFVERVRKGERTDFDCRRPIQSGRERGLDFDSRGEMICRDCILAS